MINYRPITIAQYLVRDIFFPSSEKSFTFKSILLCADTAFQNPMLGRMDECSREKTNYGTFKLTFVQVLIHFLDLVDSPRINTAWLPKNLQAHARLAQQDKHYTLDSLIIRLSPSGGKFLFAVVKFVDAKTANIDNFVLNAKNSD